MTIKEITKEKIVEEIVAKVGQGENTTDLQDLCQDIYLSLITKDKDKLLPLNIKEVKYYISRVAVNNILSKNSRYYYQYKKDKKLFTDDKKEK